MGRTAGRSPEDTRSLLLSAAAEMIRAKGSSATLDDIAGHAGCLQRRTVVSLRQQGRVAYRTGQGPSSASSGSA